MKPDKSEQITELIKQAYDLLQKDGKEQAKKISEEVLELDPESLDGHVLAADVAAMMSKERVEHLKFIVDRDITYKPPKYITRGREGLMDMFISALEMYEMGQEKEGAEEDADKYKQEFATQQIEYSSRALAASVSIPDIYDFVEKLLVTERYDDVIKVGFFLSKDKTAAEIGWPGLDYSKSYREIESNFGNVMQAYFETRRYIDGCRWIYKCLLEYPDDIFVWQLVGESLACLGYPEETARAWIIAVEKGNYSIKEDELFETLAYMVCDENYRKKNDMYTVLWLWRDKIPPELKDVYNELQSLTYSAMRDPDKPVPSQKFIEKKLGIKLEMPTKQKRLTSVFMDARLEIPSGRTEDAIVTEVIKTIDKYIEDSNAKVEEGFTGVTPKKTKKQEREKVAVGGDYYLGTQAATLTQFGINVSDQVSKGDTPPIVGRDREIDRMVRILSRSEKNNPVLLGEAGVGKTAVVYGLAQRMVAGNVPDSIKGKIIVELSVGTLVAGTTYRGDFEQRMNNIIKEMRNNPNIILFIDEFHTLIGAGDSRGQMDASNILKPALTSGEMRLIGATTSHEYAKFIERDAAFERRFSPVYLNEINQQMTLQVLRARIPSWQKHHQIEIPDEILQDAIHLTDQHVKHRHFPDKAIDLIDEACALASMIAMAEQNQKVVLKTDHIKKICDQWTGATATKGLLSANFTGNIEQLLHEHIVGHEQVLKELSIIVTDEKLGLYTSKLPRVLYFYGLPDTGKTECAQALSKVLWPGEKERFLYIDMELFDNPSDLNRLMGAPRGTLGSEEGGRLAIHLHQNPYTLVYLYNFHKAHERIVRFFANLFREGSFTDGAGRTIFAANAIFILSATVEGNAHKIGYKNGDYENAATTGPGSENIPDMLRNLHLPKEIFHFMKGTFFFNELTEAELRKLIERKIDSIKNQPSIRELKPQLGDDLVDTIVQHYREQPLAQRNIRSMFQKYVYPAIMSR
jgi:ATP-dependent Clp protease ATP-binding subunit ClpC